MARKKKSTTFRVDKIRNRVTDSEREDNSNLGQQWIKQIGGFVSEEAAQEWITNSMKMDSGAIPDDFRIVGE
tara:strand:- start:726 stop:941 length:216 start_codon:yes stop_codon:yes gene_type:complete